MKRIEDALGRIEAAAGRTVSSDVAHQDDALRGRVTNTLRELDELIGKLER